MTLEPWIAGLLALAIVAGSGRALVRRLRLPVAQRPRGWRLALLAVLQVASAALLYCVLVPPSRPVPSATLVVHTARAGDARTAAQGTAVVHLPEATGGAGDARAPDLATALRRYPGSVRLHVVGAGLVARDRDAAAGLPVVFSPAPAVPGIDAVHAPQRVQVGDRFAVHGHVQGVAGVRVELLDPSGRRVDMAVVTGDGGFRTRGLAAAAGPALFSLRLLDARGRPVDRVPVALVVGPPAPRRLLLLGGAPGPELKFLRRWAGDAGLDLETAIALGGGVQLGQAAGFDRAALDRFDLVVLDERALQSLDAARFDALEDAVRAGLGVLVRVTGPVGPAATARLRALGHQLADAPVGSAVRLAAAGGTGPVAAARPALARRTLRIASPGSVVLLADAAGEPLARVRNLGQGRVATWLLADTFRLVLTGHGGEHARLWSDALATVGRAAPALAPRFAGEARAGGRMRLCGIRGAARVRAPDGQRTSLAVDGIGDAACAGYWPLVAGWHVLEAGADWPFHVAAADAAPAVAARGVREATARLAAEADATAPIRPPARVPGPRWPWLLAWLCASGLLWWLERTRHGRRAWMGDVAAPGRRRGPV